VEALVTEWTTLSAALPAQVAAIESRVNILSKSKKLPANLDRRPSTPSDWLADAKTCGRGDAAQASATSRRP